MARLSGPGRDFDDQYNESRRQGEAKAARGESHWAADAALKKIRITEQPDQSGPKHAKSSDSCIVALASLGGLGWAISEAIRYCT